MGAQAKRARDMGQSTPPPPELNAAARAPARTPLPTRLQPARSAKTTRVTEARANAHLPSTKSSLPSDDPVTREPAMAARARATQHDAMSETARASREDDQDEDVSAPR